MDALEELRLHDLGGFRARRQEEAEARPEEDDHARLREDRVREDGHSREAGVEAEHHGSVSRGTQALEWWEANKRPPDRPSALELNHLAAPRRRAATPTTPPTALTASSSRRLVFGTAAQIRAGLPGKSRNTRNQL